MRLLLIPIKTKILLEYLVEDERIILCKFKNQPVCAITGVITDENKKYGDGNLVLSPKGAKDIVKRTKET